MAVCAKIWDPDREREPHGLFNQETCPEAPPRWFEEEPEYAAELFGMETKRSGTLSVLDTEGRLHRIRVEVSRELHAEARRV